MSLISTMIDGLKSSRVFCRLIGFGEVTEINSDPDIGSGKVKGKNSPTVLVEYGWGGLTVDVDLICCALNPMLAVMHDSRGVDEVNHVWIIRARGELQGEKIFVEAHSWYMGGTCVIREPWQSSVVASFVAAANAQCTRIKRRAR